MVKETPAPTRSSPRKKSPSPKKKETDAIEWQQTKKAPTPKKTASPIKTVKQAKILKRISRATNSTAASPTTKLAIMRQSSPTKGAPSIIDSSDLTLSSKTRAGRSPIKAQSPAKKKLPTLRERPSRKIFAPSGPASPRKPFAPVTSPPRLRRLTPSRPQSTRSSPVKPDALAKGVPPSPGRAKRASPSKCRTPGDSWLEPPLKEDTIVIMPIIRMMPSQQTAYEEAYGQPRINEDAIVGPVPPSIEGGRRIAPIRKKEMAARSPSKCKGVARSNSSPVEESRGRRISTPSQSPAKNFHEADEKKVKTTRGRRGLSTNSVKNLVDPDPRSRLRSHSKAIKREPSDDSHFNFDMSELPRRRTRSPAKDQPARLAREQSPVKIARSPARPPSRSPAKFPSRSSSQLSPSRSPSRSKPSSRSQSPTKRTRKPKSQSPVKRPDKRIPKYASRTRAQSPVKEKPKSAPQKSSPSRAKHPMIDTPILATGPISEIPRQRSPFVKPSHKPSTHPEPSSPPKRRGRPPLCAIPPSNPTSSPAPSPSPLPSPPPTPPRPPISPPPTPKRPGIISSSNPRFIAGTSARSNVRVNRGRPNPFFETLPLKEEWQRFQTADAMFGGETEESKTEEDLAPSYFSGGIHWLAGRIAGLWQKPVWSLPDVDEAEVKKAAEELGPFFLRSYKRDACDEAAAMIEGKQGGFGGGEGRKRRKE